MWILYTLLCAASQATWIALSKLRLGHFGPLRFALYLRLPIIPMMAPLLLLCDPPHWSWRLAAIAGAAIAFEVLRIVCITTGVRQDYYATYALLNTAPLFLLFVGPLVFGETVTWWVIGGALAVVAGALVFFHCGHLTAVGLASAVVQAAVTTMMKLGVAEVHPIVFMFLAYTGSTLVLLAVSLHRHGRQRLQSELWSVSRAVALISTLNLVAMVTFVLALSTAPITRYAVLIRTNLVFGFILSLVMLKEYDAWPWKLAGATLILLGGALIVAMG